MKILIIMALAIFLPPPLGSQELPKLNPKDLIESYVENSYEYFSFADKFVLEDLSAMEKLNVKSDKYTTQVNIYKLKGERVKEIFYLKHPAHPQWMKLPSKTILTENEAWSIDENGEVLAYTSIPKEDKKIKKEDVILLEYYLENFIPLSDENVNKMSLPGTIIKKSKSHKFSLENDDMYLEWDTNELTKKSKFKDKEGNNHLNINKYYKKDELGEIILAAQLDERYLKSKRNQKEYQKRTLKVYSNHWKKKKKKNNDDKKQKLQMSSPHLINTIVDSELNIWVADKVNGEFLVEIINLNGQVMMNRRILQPESLETFVLTELPSGLYFCVMNYKSMIYTQKFICR